MITDNGGPAFPSPPVVENGVIYPGNDGMTLRDAAALAVLPAAYADAVADFDETGYPEDWREGVARGCYAMADAMLKARECRGSRAMTHNRYMAAAHRLQAQAYRAYALAASLDPHANEERRREQVDHYTDLSTTYDGLAADYLKMENLSE